jgi:(E)-4-hydroxy-3-methylbut-2-enyl-diphosphate synthase
LERTKNPIRQYPLFCGEEFFNSEKTHSELNFVAVTKDVLTPEFISKIKNTNNVVLIADSFNPHAMPELRRLFISLQKMIYQLACNH